MKTTPPDPEGSGGRYEVLGEFARGGMGVILRVRDKLLRRDLAMKVLRDGESPRESQQDSQRSGRFVEEAQVTGQLEHPGVVPVHEFGLDEEQRLYFTMRLVKGKTLDEVFDLARAENEGWTATRALGVLLKVCETMAFAHDKGVLHRDLKPANVMVGRFGETYVMDWGLAKVMGEDENEGEGQESLSDRSLQSILTTARQEGSSHGDSSMDTLEGDVIGTPSYMPPEQARGELNRLGPRSDVYSVGAMLYRLLTGHAPYATTAENPIAILQQLLEGPPLPVEELAPDTSPELVAICGKAMAGDPGERYGSMLELSDDLHAYLDGRTVRAHRTGAVVELVKWVRRNRGLAAALGLALVATVAGLGGISYVQTKARGEVEAKARELGIANETLEAERSRTAAARDRAVASETRALDSEEEALWQSYVGNLSGALASLEIGSASEARRRLAACPEELRGLEWRYLNERANGSRRTLTGIPTFVFAMDVHPREPLVAAAGGDYGDTGTQDFAIRVWNHETGELVALLEGAESTVTSLSFSPTGDALVSAEDDGHVRIWDVASQGQIVRSPAPLGIRVAYHPDWRFVVGAEHFQLAGTRNSFAVSLWDTLEDRVVRTVQIPAGANEVRPSPDGRTIAVACHDDRVRLLDGETLELRATLDTSPERPGGARPGATFRTGPGVCSVDFSPDGRRLVTGSDDGFVRTWDLETGERLHFFAGHRSSVLSVRWHPGGLWIASSDAQGAVRTWDAATGKPLETLRGHDGEVFVLGFSELGDRLLSCSQDATVRVWDGQPGSTDVVAEGVSIPNFQPYELAFSADGTRVAWRRDWEQVRVTDVRTGEDVCTIAIPGELGSVRALAFAEDDQELHLLSATGDLHRWDPTTGEHLGTLETGIASFQAAFSPDGELLAVGTRTLQLLDATSGEVHWTTLLGGVAWSLAFSADGQQLYVGENEAIVALDLATGEPLWRREHPGTAFDLVADPGGAWIATTTYNRNDRTLFVWDARTGEPLATHQGHAQPARLALSPDGARVLSGNWNGTVSFWSPERGELFTLPAHQNIVTRVGFGPGGDVFASLGADGRARLWNATPVETRDEVRGPAARRLRWGADAHQRVEALLERHLHAQAVVEALGADPSLEPDRRDAAILEARRRGNAVAALTVRSRRVTSASGQPPVAYLRALEAARIAVDVDPKSPTARDALGAAQFRMGLDREALASLVRAEELRDERGLPHPPTSLYVRAMANHRLGLAAEATSDLRSARIALAQVGWNAETAERARALREEAEALLQSR